MIQEVPWTRCDTKAVCSNPSELESNYFASKRIGLASKSMRQRDGRTLLEIKIEDRHRRREIGMNKNSWHKQKLMYWPPSYVTLVRAPNSYRKGVGWHLEI